MIGFALAHIPNIPRARPDSPVVTSEGSGRVRWGIPTRLESDCSFDAVVIVPETRCSRDGKEVVQIEHTRSGNHVTRLVQ